MSCFNGGEMRYFYNLGKVNRMNTFRADLKLCDLGANTELAAASTPGTRIWLVAHDVQSTALTYIIQKRNALPVKNLYGFSCTMT